jgi:hypothetical protein
LLLLAAAPLRAQTQQQVVFDLTGFTIQDGLSQSGSSGSLLPPAFAYSYVISGTVHGTGNLANLIPPGTSLATAVNILDPNASPPFSDNLQGTVVNPAGTLPFYILTNKTASGTLAGGIINASATFNLWVDATGRANFSITDVSFVVFGNHDTSDTIVFDSGSVTTTAVLSPVAITGTASSVTGSTAVLNASVNPNGDSATVTFEYGLTSAYGMTTTGTVPLGLAATPVTATVTGLTSGTTYHYAVEATNSTGETTGSDQTFMTAAAVVSGSAPTATTGTATNVTAASATLNGTVNPNGAATTVTFNYGLTSGYGMTATVGAIGSGTSPVAVNAGVASLLSGTLYHFQVTGSNSQGVTPGGDQTFMTSVAAAPTVATNPATVTGTSTAILNGSVNPNGMLTTAFFEYGLSSTDYTITTPSVSVGMGASAVLTTATLTGLQAGATYHFRAMGASTSGTTSGADQMFTTAYAIPEFAGKYEAALTGTSNATCGLATVTVTTKGSFSASVELAGRSLGFSGKFGSDGSASIAKSGVTLQLQLGDADGGNTVTGTVTGPVQLTFVAQALLKTTTAQAYTVRLPNPALAGVPEGNGYGVLTVGKNGAIHVAGKLGDGTSFSASGGLLANGTWALYAPLYSKQGCIAGTITFEATANGDLDGPVTWIKPETTGAYSPAAFTAQVNLYGSIYTKPVKGSPVITSTSGKVEFNAGDLAAPPLDISATLSSANKFVFPTPLPDGVKMTISTSNGLFSGSFKDPTTNATRKFNGAVFQGGLQFGTGEFKGTTEAGSVDFFEP